MFSFIKWSSSPGGTKGAELVGPLPPPPDQHDTIDVVGRKNLKRKRAGINKVLTPAQIQRQAMKEQKARLQARMAATKKSGGEENTHHTSSPTSKSRAGGHITSNHMSDVADQHVSSELQDTLDISTMEQRIEAQFNLEILLKHRELRLIEQEIAKCQTSLEQLRRCHLIPFPTTSIDSENMEHISNGDGPVLSGTDAAPQPQWPAPWGVTDGPYAKHYAKWLIPDPSFDGHQPEGSVSPSITVAGKSIIDSRSGRGSISEKSLLANKARPHRGVASGKLHALSNGYPQPKDKSSPLIVKRTSDNVFVKLVCIDCDRGDFSSAQGFINHCRIAHHRGFESHDAAAAACGQPVELDEHGGVVGVEEANTQGGPPLVHPMIRAATIQQMPPKLAPVPVAAEQKPPKPIEEPPTKGAKRKRNNGKTQKGHGRHASIAVAFIPSTDTPFLSAYMEKKGVGGNLDEMVGEAQKKEDFDMSTSSDEEDEEDNEHDTKAAGTDAQDGTPPTRQSEMDDDRLRVARTPGRAGMSPAPLVGRPNSSKGVEKGSRKPGNLSSVSPHQQYALPVTTNSGIGKARSHRHEEVVEIVDHDTPVNLSPNTLESQTAPSLVSDDDDYEAHSESASSPSSAEAEDEVLVEVEDSEESETSVTDPEIAPAAVKTRRGAMRGSNGGDRRRTRKEDKHVSFVSPAKEPDTRGVARRSNRKR